MGLKDVNPSELVYDWHTGCYKDSWGFSYDQTGKYLDDLLDNIMLQNQTINVLNGYTNNDEKIDINEIITIFDVYSEAEVDALIEKFSKEYCGTALDSSKYDTEYTLEIRQKVYNYLDTVSFELIYDTEEITELTQQFAREYLKQIPDTRKKDNPFEKRLRSTVEVELKKRTKNKDKEIEF